MWRLKRVYYWARHIWRMGDLGYAVAFITHSKLASRKGECLKCGKCCGTRNKCEFLEPMGCGMSVCALYNDKEYYKKAPWCFKECPYHPLGLAQGCGYHWSEK